MLINNDVVSVIQALMTEKYKELLERLRLIGHRIKQAWLESPSSNNVEEKFKFTSNREFEAFLVKHISDAYVHELADIKDILQHMNTLKNQLSELAIFLMVWKDKSELPQESETEQPVSESEKKLLHQEVKFKALLDKDDRHDINIALQTMAFILCQQSNNFIKHQEKISEIHEFNAFPVKDINQKIKNIIDNQQDHLDFISDHIKRLNNFASNRFEVTNNESTSEQNLKNEAEIKIKIKIEKIGHAISSFLTPNKKKKFLKYTGILLAIIASLACGLTTGGAIYLLGPSLLAFGISLGMFTFLVGLTFNRSLIGIAVSLVCSLAMGGVIYSLGLLLAPSLALLLSAIFLGGLTGLFGFTANFAFFSKNFPEFLLSLVKKGSISEYIDIHGKRKQFSATYKYLLTPLVIFASLTVGAGTTALTYITILSLFAKLATLLPVLAIIWPPLPVILAVVLAAAVGIALTVAVMTASLEALKKVAALNLGFVQLCQYTYKNCKAWVENLRNLDKHEIVGLVILLLLLPVGLAGLAYFRYTAGVDLSVFIGITGAIVTGVVAYIAQMAFICLSINKLKNAIIRPSASSNDFPALTVNAGGNGVLVYDGSPVSIAGMVACIVNSFSGNMSKADMRRQQREQATKQLVEESTDFFSRTTDAAASAAPSRSDSYRRNGRIRSLSFSHTTGQCQFLPEPTTPTPSSPSGSENGRMSSYDAGGSAANCPNNYEADSPRLFTVEKKDKTAATANQARLTAA